MDTIMGIHTSSNLIWHYCSSSPCLSCICNLSCNKRTGEEGLHKATFLLYTHHWSGADEVSGSLSQQLITATCDECEGHICIAASRWLLVEQKQRDFHWWIGSRDCNHASVAIDDSNCNITSRWFNDTQIIHWLLVKANATKQMVHRETSSGSIMLIEFSGIIRFTLLRAYWVFATAKNTHEASKLENLKDSLFTLIKFCSLEFCSLYLFGVSTFLKII